jgi:signal transduction histidine kinase
VSARRFRLAAVLVPALLLGVGWWLTSLREAALVRDEAARVQRATADRIRAVVDTSLEELRAREDRRPFYLYNHYYSPPDVLAVVDPVAVSPLARAPTDTRVLGHLQLDPDGTLRVPYTPSGKPDGDPLAARVLAGVDDDMIGRLRLLTRADPVALAEAKQLQEKLAAPAGQQAQSDQAQSAQQQQLALNDEVGNAYTVSLNSWSNRLAEDIQRYNSSAEQQQEEVAVRQSPGPETFFKQQRVAPKTKRRLVPDEPEPRPSKLGKQNRRPSKAAAPPVAEQKQGDDGAAGQRLRAAQADRAREQVRRRQDDGEEVDYTPMRWERVGDELLLTRTVSHGGVTSAQAVRIDLEDVNGRWLPGIVGEHAPVEQTVWLATDGPRCDAPVAISDVLPGANLCFDTIDAGGTPWLQGLMLLALLAAVALAGLTTVRAEQRAAELAEQQGAFVSAVSHELRTPLTTIRMNAEMLADGLVSEKKKKTFLDRQVSESVRLSHLVENVLEVSRMDAGHRKMRLVEADLGQHVRDVVTSQRPFLASRAATVEAIVPDAPVVARFDAQAIEQVLINLLENGAKYGRDPATDAASLSVRLLTEGDRIRLQVADQGPGVAEEAREKVFERFFRARRDDDAHVVGTGLGLSLVRDLVRAHGGEVHLLPVAQGCTVEVVLPLR